MAESPCPVGPALAGPTGHGRGAGALRYFFTTRVLGTDVDCAYCALAEYRATRW